MKSKAIVFLRVIFKQIENHIAMFLHIFSFIISGAIVFCWLFNYCFARSIDNKGFIIIFVSFLIICNIKFFESMVEHIVKEKINSFAMKEYQELFIDSIEKWLTNPENPNNIQIMIDKTLKNSNDIFTKTNFTDKAN